MKRLGSEDEEAVEWFGACVVCGEELPAPSRLSGRPRRCCSRRCQRQARKLRAEGLPETWVAPVRSCAVCGGALPAPGPTNQRRRFCSKRCKERAHDLRAKGLPEPWVAPVRSCAVCGGVLPALGLTNQRRRFCSARCRQRAHDLRAKGLPEFLVAPVRSCVACGGALPAPGPTNSPRRFCSDRCKHRAGRRRHAGLPESWPMQARSGAGLVRSVELENPWRLGLVNAVDPRHAKSGRPEVHVAELLRASAAWVAIHPEDALEALQLMFDRLEIPRSDPRFNVCGDAVRAALGEGYRSLAELRLAEGPGAVSAAFQRAGMLSVVNRRQNAVAGKGEWYG